MKKFKKSVAHATDGIAYVYTHERNFRIHVRIALVAGIVGVVLGFEPWKWALFIIVTGMVLITETLNSAIEYSWDHLEPHHHPVVGIIKDVMAGAVLVSALCALLVGYVLIFY